MTLRAATIAAGVLLLHGCTGAPHVDADVADLPTLAAPPSPLPPELDGSAATGDPPATARPEPRSALDAWFRALEAVEVDGDGPYASMIVVGDSHTASDTFTGALRDALQGHFGDGGRGLAQPGTPWTGFRQESLVTAQTSGWASELGHRRQAVPPFSLTGVRLTSAVQGAMVTRGACRDCTYGGTFDRFSVHLIGHPGGGTVEIALDGIPIDQVTTDRPSEELIVARFGDPDDMGAAGTLAPIVDGPHAISVTATGDAEVWLTGIATDRSAGGARVESFGLNGAMAVQWAAFDGALVSAERVARAPQLIVVAFGTNEAYGDLYDVTESLAQGGADAVDDAIERERTLAHGYARTVARLIELLQYDPDETSCLVLLPPDFEEEGAPCARSVAEALDGTEVEACVTPPPRALRVIQMGLRDAAQQRGCATWDMQAAMGGPGWHSRWQTLDPPLAARDGVHLTARGYDEIGEQLFRDLFAAYRSWQLGRSVELTTGSRFAVTPPSAPE